MDAGKFWNLSKTHTKETGGDFFATHDTNKNPLENISFVENSKVSEAGGSAWNCSKTNSKDTKDLLTTSDVSKNPLGTNISFADNTIISEPTAALLARATSESNKENKRNKEEEVKDEEYCLQLVSLNKSVLEWIKKHVNKNPCIDLTPVIKDYEKHLGNIEEQFKSRSLTNQSKLLTTPEPSHTSPATSSSNKMMSFVSSTPISNSDPSAAPKFPPAGFFSQPPASVVEKAKDTGGQSSSVESGEAPDQDAPPAVERKTIVEEDAFYQTRAKLFYKKGKQWQELGVGMLYLKPCEEKIQLLIRMEAATGKVLLNINISNDIPVSRSGKNNVMVVSVPNPPVYVKAADGDNSLPCTYLIRVKDGQEADVLFSKLKT